MIAQRIAPVAAAFFLVCATEAAAQPSDSNFTITPYIWLPTVEADLRFDAAPGVTGRPSLRVGPVDYLENLEGALMLQGEARYGRFGVFTDFIYLDFDNEEGTVRSVTGPGPIEVPIDIGTTSALTGTVWSLVGGYDFIQNEDVRLQAFGGFRYMDVDASADIRLSGPLNQFPQEASVSGETQIWDGIVGVRGEGRAGAWIFPFYADIGAGDSEFTWQASGGVGYRWGWGDVHLSYRHMEIEQGDDALIEDMSFSGPSLGASFHF